MVGRKNFSYVLAALPVLLAIVCLLVSPAKYGKSILDGISLWAVCVLPATFPFLFLTAVLTRLKLFEKLSARLSPLFSKVFKISGAGGCAAILSALSGYPVGARTVLDLYESGRLDENERFRLSCLASTTGPMFLVGTVGTNMFSSPAMGWMMLFCHYVAVFGVCFCMRSFGTAPRKAVMPAAKSGNTLYDSLYTSVISILCVGGSIALFHAFSEMILSFFRPMSSFSEGVVRGLMEMTAGCKAFAGSPSPLSMAMCCFFVTFGGACVLMQQLAFLTRAGVRTLPFLAVKLLQGILAGALCFALAWLL